MSSGLSRAALFVLFFGSLWSAFYLRFYLPDLTEKQMKAVKLCLRQGESPHIFHRVLRCNDHKRLRQLIGFSVYGRLYLLHAFQKSGLRFGRRAVYFVCQHDIGENRSGNKFKLRLLDVEEIDAGDV